MVYNLDEKPDLHRDEFQLRLVTKYTKMGKLAAQEAAAAGSQEAERIKNLQMTQGKLNFSASPKRSPTIDSQKQLEEKSLSEEEKKRETMEEPQEGKGTVSSSYQFVEIDEIMERPSSRWH